MSHAMVLPNLTTFVLDDNVFHEPRLVESHQKQKFIKKIIYVRQKKGDIYIRAMLPVS